MAVEWFNAMRPYLGAFLYQPMRYGGAPVVWANVFILDFSVHPSICQRDIRRGAPVVWAHFSYWRRVFIKNVTRDAETLPPPPPLSTRHEAGPAPVVWHTVCNLVCSISYNYTAGGKKEQNKLLSPGTQKLFELCFFALRVFQLLAPGMQKSSEFCFLEPP